MVAQAFDHLKSQGADGRIQWIGPQSARGPEVVLGRADGDAGKTVHHVAVRIIAEAGIEDEFAALRVRRVPVAFGPAYIAGSDVIESGWQLVAQEVVLRRE